MTTANFINFCIFLSWVKLGLVKQICIKYLKLVVCNLLQLPPTVSLRLYPSISEHCSGEEWIKFLQLNAFLFNHYYCCMQRFSWKKKRIFSLSFTVLSWNEKCYLQRIDKNKQQIKEDLIWSKRQKLHIRNCWADKKKTLK